MGEESNKKIWFYALGIIFLFGIAAFFGNLLFHYMIGKPLEHQHERKTMEMNYSFLDEDKFIAREGVFNFLLLGVDEREVDSGRSDTIIVASVNFKDHKAALLSIPRDTMVEIPTHGKTKINHAYAFGGERLTKTMVEKITGIKIDHIVIANFTAFKSIVNSLGGIDIDVEKDMYYRDDYDGPEGFTIDLQKGKQHLDGSKALQYVRYRDDEGDIGRAKRQQKFLKEFSKKFISANIITEAPNIVRQFSSSIRTDIKFSDLVNFIRSVDPKKDIDVKSIVFAGKPETIDDLSYWILDKEENKQQLLSMNDFVTSTETFKPKPTVVAQAPAKKPDKQQEQKQETKPEPKKEDKPAPKVEEKKEEPKKDIFLAGDPRDLDWQIAKLTAENEQRKDAREKLLKEEEEERRRQAEEELAQQIQNVSVIAIETERKPNRHGVTIINTTSDESLANLAISYLEEEGIPIGVVSSKGTGKPNQKTLFVVGSDDTNTISALRRLPFRFSTLLRNKMDKPTLIIGEDFS